jgi:hypothetical protein
MSTGAGVGIAVSNNTALQLFRFSNLTNITAAGDGISISNNNALQALDFTNLVAITGGTVSTATALHVVSNNALTNFTFPSLIDIASSGRTPILLVCEGGCK